MSARQEDKPMTSAEYEKEFIKGFQSLCRVRSDWDVWQCLMSAWACALSNAFDKSENHYQAREEEYAECIRKLGGSNEVPAKLFAILVNALERDPDQDFLGKLYMNLNLGNHWKGQFFTPYNICRMMALWAWQAPPASCDMSSPTSRGTSSARRLRSLSSRV